MFVVTHSFKKCCLPFSYLHFQGQGQRAKVTVIEFIGLVIKSCFMVDIQLIFSYLFLVQNWLCGKSIPNVSFKCHFQMTLIHAFERSRSFTKKLSKIYA